MKKISFQPFLSVAVLIFVINGKTLAQSQGPNTPTTFSTSALSGSVSTYANQSNAQYSDDVRASSANNLASSGNYTDYMVTSGFGFSIPFTATITGVTVNVERSDDNVKAKDNRISIVKGGSVGWQDKSNVLGWPASDGVVTYGSATDLWGETWTATDINASNFGFAFSAKRQGSGPQACYAVVDQVTITVHYISVLPIQLTSFNATVQNESEVKVHWETASELNNDYFLVERSLDGSNFTELARIEGAGTSTIGHAYNVMDDGAINGEINYYRVKQYDIDGQCTASPIVSVAVNREVALEVLIYPNPITTSFKIELKEGVQSLSDKNIRIYNMASRNVTSLFRFAADDAGNLDVMITGEMEPGVYFLQMDSGAELLVSRKFVIY